MRDVSSFDQIFLHRVPVDGRKQINGLSLIVQSQMGKDPFSPALFVFIGKRADLLRFLYWDKTGFAMWVKRLEKEKFRWPVKVKDDVITLAARELAWLLAGLDITRMRPHETLTYRSVK